jgi:flagellar hook-associated protein 1 FlgK
MPIVYPANILGTLHLARRALASQQSALQTIGHNLANVATPGYTQQRTELVNMAIQNGVDVAAIQRLRDRFADAATLAEEQALGKSQAEAGVLQRLEGIVNDGSGAGLGAVLDQFFGTFQDLATAPADTAVRATVVDAGARVASTLTSMRARIVQIRDDLTSQIRSQVADVNSLLTQISDLHRQIANAQTGPTPNDLLDQRDRLVSQLNQIVGVSTSDRSDGTVQIALAGSGILLVDGVTTAQLTATVNGVTDTVDLTAGAAATPITPRSGALAGTTQARNLSTGAVKQALSDLDALAGGVIAEVNRLHAGGAGLTGHTSLTAVNAVSSSSAALTAAGLATTPVTGSFRVLVHDGTGAVASSVTVNVTAGVTTLDDVRAALDADPYLSATISAGTLTIGTAAGSTFSFGGDSSDTLMALGLNTFFTGSSAGTIAVNPLVSGDLTKLAAAQADAGGLVHAGDGANALALARLRTDLTMTGDTLSFGDFYGGVVGRVGSASRDAQQAVDRGKAAVELTQGLQQQAEGVSTDDQLIYLTQSQQAYAAMARYVTVIQDALDALLRIV